MTERLAVSVRTVLFSADDDVLQLSLSESLAHTVWLTGAEARTVLSWLRAGTGGTLADGDGEVWLTLTQDDGITLTAEDEVYAGLTALAEVLEAGLTALAANPPRPAIPDHDLGRISGTSSAGEAVDLGVSVEAEQLPGGGPRLMVDWVGTWWLTDEEAESLAAALSGGELSLHEGSRTTPWLSVVRTDGRVRLQLTDELVEEGGGDGVFWLTEADAVSLAGMLRAALAWAAESPVRLYVPPEPGWREVVRA